MARKLTGVVTSDVQDKTITVAVSRSVTHPIYGKRYTITKKYAVHDETNKAHKGDKVEITETRPISKRKSWLLSTVVGTGHTDVQIKGEELVADKEAARREGQSQEALPAEKAKPARKAAAARRPRV